MATQYIELNGKVNYARIFQRNMDTKFGEKFSVDFFPDTESMERLKKSGFRGKIRETPEGELYVKLTRDNKTMFRNVETVLGPPEVVDTSGNVVEDFLGNGSGVKLTLEVYQSKYGTGSRLRKVQVTNHIPYVPRVIEETNVPPVD